jgi:hypothetical protein
MKSHEREYFVSRIRSGVQILEGNEISIKIVPLTIEDTYFINKTFMEAFNKAQADGFLTHEEMLEESKKRGLWTDEDEEKEKGLQKDIDRLKVELFNNRNMQQLRQQIRIYLEAGKKQLGLVTEKKFTNFELCCEGIAQQQKIGHMLRVCTLTKEDEKFDFDDMPIDYLIKLYGSSILTEKQVRELARNEPWRNLWLMNEANVTNLFSTKYGKRELTTDQKNIILWSKMYDNVQESMDSPSQDVIDDDDMLDGWFIIQKKKSETQRAESEINDRASNSKIANSDEIFVFTDNKADANKINDINSVHSQTVKKQRMNVIQSKGEARDLDFQDQKLKLGRMSNDMYKGKFRR